MPKVGSHGGACNTSGHPQGASHSVYRTIAVGDATVFVQGRMPPRGGWSPSNETAMADLLPELRGMISER